MFVAIFKIIIKSSNLREIVNLNFLSPKQKSSQSKHRQKLEGIKNFENNSRCATK